MIPFVKFTPSSQAKPSPSVSEKRTAFCSLSVMDSSLRLNNWSLPFLFKSERSYVIMLVCADATVVIVKAIITDNKIFKLIFEVKEITSCRTQHINRRKKNTGIGFVN